MAVSAKRNARIELTAGAKGVDRGVNDARRSLRTFQREQAREARKAAREAARQKKAEEKSRAKSVRQAKSAGSSVLQGVGMAIGIDSVNGVKEIMSGVLDYERALTRLQITADKSPEVMRAFSDGIMRASNATGLNRKDILDAAASYVALTGDMATAQQSTATWAKIAQATGTPIQDVASTAAAMSQQLGITSDNMEAVFSGLAAQGKAGAIELKDLAGLMAQIAPQWAQFKDAKGARGIAELGAALQVVKRGFGGDAAETVTGLQSLLTALVKEAGRFEDAGVKIFDVKNGKKTMKDVFSIVDAISKSKLVKDPEAMQQAFGRVEAYRAYLQLSQNRQELDRLAQSAKDAGLIQRDFDTYMNSSAGKIDQAWTQAKNSIVAAFTPERIAAFSGALVEAVKLFAKIVGYIDKTASWISHLTGPNEEERTDQQVKGQLAFSDRQDKKTRELLGDTPGASAMIMSGYRSKADALYKHAAELYAGADARGGMTEDERVDFESSQRTAAIYRLRGDPWAPGNVRSQGDSEFVDRVTKGTSLTREDAQKIALNDLKYEITKALRDAVSGLSIKVGSEPIQKAGASSIQHRRGQH